MIIFESESVKFEFMEHIMRSMHKILYVDVDLLMAGYIKSGLIKPESNMDIIIMDDIAKGIVEAISKADDILIFDSIDTFSILYGEHISSIYLNLISLHTSKMIVFSKRIMMDELFDVILDADNRMIIKHPEFKGLEFDYHYGIE